MGTAVAWILHGTLLDSMAYRAAAFALASSSSSRRAEDVEDLASWALSPGVSGASAQEKMRRYNAERGGAIGVDIAARRFSRISGVIDRMDLLFPGAEGTLAALHGKGARNYITSVTDQRTLDAWLSGPQGARIAGYLAQALGERGDGFTKGDAHFDHIYAQGNERVFLVADAPAEMRMAKGYGRAGVVRVGVAHEVTPGAVTRAYSLLQGVLHGEGTLPEGGEESYALDASRLRLPRAGELERELVAAGADATVRGAADEIMGGLDRYFSQARM